MDAAARTLAAESELKKYGQFMEEHNQKLEAQLAHIKEDSRGGRTRILGLFGPQAACLNPEAREEAQLAPLILSSTDNKMLGKVILALTAVSSEMDFLVSDQQFKQRFLHPLHVYGSGLKDGLPDHGDTLLAICRFLPTLHELHGYVEHCSEVLRNALHQLSGLFGDNPGHEIASGPLVDVSNLHFQVVLEKVSQLLVALITLDALVEGQPMLREHWAVYKRVIKAAQLEPDKFVWLGSVASLKRVERLLGPVEQIVIGANMLKTCIEQNFDVNGFRVSHNRQLAEEMLFCIRTTVMQVDSELAPGGQLDYSRLDPTNPLKFVGLSALVVLYQIIFKLHDKRLLSSFMDLCKKVPGISLHGSVMWFPEQLLSHYFPSSSPLMDKKWTQSLVTNRQAFLHSRSQSGPQQVRQAHHSVSAWAIRMENLFKLELNNLTLEHLQRVGDVLLHGLQLACSLSMSLKNVINLHGKLSVPISRANVIILCKLVEQLKAIQVTFRRHSLSITSVVSHAAQHSAYTIINILERVKRSFLSGSDKKLQPTRLDHLSALILAEKMILAAATDQRRLIARVALSFVAPSKSYREEDVQSLCCHLQRFSVLSRIQFWIGMACDTFFLYAHRIMVPTYFDYIYDQKDAFRLPYVFMALEDCAVMLERAKHLPSPSVLTQSFEEEIRNHFTDKILRPLFCDVETDLRLQAHAHLQLDENNPFKVGKKPIVSFLHLPAFPFMSKCINVRACVESYLERTFYNLTTLALHNWRTYGQMRALASLKFHTESGEDHLPAQTLDQGLDVLVIMRDLQSFVSGYHYNLNNQIFVEKSSPNKHLNTLNIGHVANSIRTHGTGVMNTTVNYAYLFLRAKFRYFSQFLSDERIKSPLSKNIRLFRDQRDELKQKFPFDKADRFNKGIRRLGLPDGVMTHLDLFRMLITEIGNALGYVRMIRSGGLRFVAKAIRFIPDLDDIPHFETLLNDEGLSCLDPETVTAAKTVDEVVTNLSHSFSRDTDYMQILVRVFQRQINCDKHAHLKNFFMIVPPLTINFVDSLIRGKENLAKNHRQGAAFTDDGLAMGIAYVLQLLGQDKEFDSLHWFVSVREKYAHDLVVVAKEKAEATDAKLQQTLELRLKRLQSEQREFELLDFCLSSARIFFRCAGSEHSQEP